VNRIFVTPDNTSLELLVAVWVLVDGVNRAKDIVVRILIVYE